MNRRRHYNQLFKLLNLIPSNEDDRKKLDCEAIILEARQNPKQLGTTYYFSSSGYCSRLLHQAIRLGAPYRVVLALCTKYALRQQKGETALHIAVDPECNKDLDIVRLLISKWPKAALNRSGTMGETPLHYACALNAAPEVVSLLLHYCPEASRAKDVFGWTPMYLACYTHANPSVISMLLNSWPDGVKEKCGPSNWLPLHTACYQTVKTDLDYENKFETIKLLLEKWPEASREEDWIEEVPSYYVEKESKDSDITLKVLSYISRLCDNEVDDASAEEMIRFFGNIQWKWGVSFVIDRCPHIVQDLKTAEEIMRYFVEMEFKSGVFLVLDRNSLVATCNDKGIDTKLFPTFLSMIGRHCKLDTMWDIMSNKQYIMSDL